MRSLVGGIRAARAPKPPVTYAPTRATFGNTMGGAAAQAGAPTSQHLAVMGAVGTLSAIVGRTSEAVAGVDWRLYRKAKPGEPRESREEVTSHAALDLWNQPNPFMTRQELVEAGQQHYELTGEEWWVVNKAGSLPLELWPVRPDRMRPVPSPTEYLSGYVYRDPDGEDVPLDRGNVIFIRRPNPLDPYRGLGVVQSILVDLDSARFTAEWNRNFFLNSAEPGGIIQVDKRLSDDEFTEMVMRWREQHQGVAQAHRVAVLEQGQWIDRKFSIRDMQFPELRTLTSEVIREGFAFPKPLLGTVTDVNRSNAEAAEVQFARWLLVPRLERLKQALNADLLPMYGRTATGLEWDYVSPVPDDAELELKALTARTTAYVMLTSQGGVTPESAAEVCGLPEMEHQESAAVLPVPPQRGPLEPPTGPPEGEPGDGDVVPEDRRRPAVHAHRHTVRAVAAPLLLPDPPDDGTPPVLPDDATQDLDTVQDQWETAVAAILALWLAASDGDDNARARSRWGAAGIKGHLVEQIHAAVQGGDLLALTRLTVDTTAVGETLGARLVEYGQDAARQVVAEAAAQGLAIGTGMVDRTALTKTGQLAAATLADGLKMTAAREAARVWGPGITADQVAAHVADALASLTDAQPQLVVGGAATAAEAAGREATILAGPSAALYASESRDATTCSPCSAVDGRWVGDSNDPARPWRALYPVRGYVACLGRDRCRGMLTAVWRGGSDWRRWVEQEPVEQGGDT